MNHLAKIPTVEPLATGQFEKFTVYTERQLDRIPQLQALTEEQRFTMKVVAKVLPFRVNRYVIEQLIDWQNAERDPIFRLTFPQYGMLGDADFVLKKEAEFRSFVESVRFSSEEAGDE